MRRIFEGGRRLRLGLAIALTMGSVGVADSINGFSERFDRAPARGWQVAHYTFSHPAFDTDWSRDNLRFDHGLHLSLTPQTAAENRFLGASIRRETRTHYGRYEAILHPAKGPGLVTGFFTYTGPHYGTRHDEIDIEFLGQDTTKMQIAWFVDGQLTAHKVALGFDAADKPRRYAFEWHPDRLRWFVEDRLIFEVTEDAADLPKEPGFLFANLWAVDKTVQSWAGLTAENTTAQAYVGQMRFAPLEALTAGLPRAETPPRQLP
ncbi:family 16 glycosylhydrolase [uncultured Shimia sp.]|uniref:family 16 glycosylhydrolase n=1 Tax=uncultured Shimia sp. TaxID=573152 RepID=UPI00262780CF|nr:family 16 glycosylhydrolase [uncultured Shimia sp.]